MASKYAKRFVVPDDFPVTLKEFSRELLRAFPGAGVEGEDALGWIYQFGAQYFKNGGASSAVAGIGAGAEQLSPAELQEKITAIFLEADTDRNGYLDRKEFKTVVAAFAEELSLPASDVRLLMAEADENEDGMIEYHEFVPLAVDVLDTLYAKRRYAAEKAEREADAVARTRHYLLHGMDRSQLDGVPRDMFQRADTNNSGYLSRKEFTEALKQSHLGLTRREMNVLLAEVDENSDGKISYEEFLPLCFNLLVEIVSRELENENVPREEKDLRDYFLAIFGQAVEEGGEGRLPLTDMMELISQAELGLTHVQLHALAGEAVVGDDGLVDFREFATAAAAVISAIINIQTSEEKSGALMEMRADEFSTINGMGKDEFDATLTSTLKGVDDGTGHSDQGTLRDALAALGLDARQVTALVSMATAPSGSCDHRTLVRYGFECLQMVAEQAVVGTV
jgi:Ca2+-binding EF-hand superfamily protein